MWLSIPVVAVVVMAIFGFLFVFVVPTLRQRRNEQRCAEARRQFYLRREWLEAEFLTAANASGKPRGLSWADCDFDDDVSFARDRQSGRLCALVGVTIRFEAIEGGGMEHVEAVSRLRAATALFQFDGERWLTEGVAQFNLNPAQVMERYRRELEAVD